MNLPETLSALSVTGVAVVVPDRGAMVGISVPGPWGSCSLVGDLAPSGTVTKLHVCCWGRHKPGGFAQFLWLLGASRAGALLGWPTPQQWRLSTQPFYWENECLLACLGALEFEV